MALVLALCSCGDIATDGQRWRCDTAADCGAGWQCGRARYCIEAFSETAGVFGDRLRLGTTAPVQDGDALGPLLQGVEAYLQEVNQRGGIHGRLLELQVLDDAGSLETARGNLRQLTGAGVGSQQVFAVISPGGSARSLIAAELAEAEQALLWSPQTGLDALEPDPPLAHVFSYRQRNSEEAEQLADYLAQGTDLQTPAHNIAALVEAAAGDPPGGVWPDAATGVRRALRRLADIAEDDVKVVTVPTPASQNANVDAAVEELTQWLAGSRTAHSDGMIHAGIVIGGSAETVVQLIRGVSDALAGARLTAPGSRLARVELRMATLSEVGSGESMVKRLKALGALRTSENGVAVTRSYGAGLLIAQPVPSIDSPAPGVVRYLESLRAYDATAVPISTSLEGYLSARLLGAALAEHGRDLTTESFTETLEAFSADLQTGQQLGFDIARHSAQGSGWGQQLGDALAISHPAGLAP